MLKKPRLSIDRNQLLNDFLERHKHLPPQGTQEWLNNRLYKIGGSEIATILGKNKYQSKKDLIKTHVGLKKFNGFFATHWGTLFEDSIRTYINKLYNCNIVETGAIPHFKYNTLAYSPDGIAVVSTKYIKHLLPDNIILDDEIVILFEFKCPYSRVPTGEIPEHYIDQPRLGMEVIPMCESAIFIEAVFKLSSYDNLKYNNIYNMSYHKDKKQILDNPIAYGILILYHDGINDDLELNKQLTIEDLIENELNDSELLEEITKEILRLKYDIKVKVGNNEVNDLSKIKTSYIINKILAGCSEKKIKCFEIDHSIQKNYDMDKFNDTNIINKFNNLSLKTQLDNNLNTKIDEIRKNGKIIYGILPYKLFSVHINPVHKTNLLTHDVVASVEKVIDVISNYMDHNNSEMDKKIIINNYK